TVGVGASAGGLEALSELLEALPHPVGAALVIVQHLDRRHDSQLTEILSRRTSLPVIEARDGLVVAANHIYVIPPNATLTLTEGRLRLTPRPAGARSSYARRCPVPLSGRELRGGGGRGGPLRRRLRWRPGHDGNQACRGDHIRPAA